jgi:hypothetical protein
MVAKTILRPPGDLKPFIVLEIYRRGGRVDIGKSKPGPDRDIYEIVASNVGVTVEERKLIIEDLWKGIHDPGRRKNPGDAKRNVWDYTMLVAVQQLKEFQGFVQKGGKPGVWELTASGMEYGRKLAEGGS